MKIYFDRDEERKAKLGKAFTENDHDIQMYVLWNIPEATREKC